RNDRLEEAKDDELARLVGRDAPGLEVEQLGLVDRAHGARRCGAAAIRLVDLEAGYRDRAGGLREVHPELAEEAVGADGAPVDDDHPPPVGARVVEARSLREQVAGRVAPNVSGERGQIEELTLTAEDDLDLFDAAP